MIYELASALGYLLEIKRGLYYIWDKAKQEVILVGSRGKVIQFLLQKQQEKFAC